MSAHATSERVAAALPWHSASARCAAAAGSCAAACHSLPACHCPYSSFIHQTCQSGCALPSVPQPAHPCLTLTSTLALLGCPLGSFLVSVPLAATAIYCLFALPAICADFSRPLINQACQAAQRKQQHAKAASKAQPVPAYSRLTTAARSSGSSWHIAATHAAPAVCAATTDRAHTLLRPPLLLDESLPPLSHGEQPEECEAEQQQQCMCATPPARQGSFFRRRGSDTQHRNGSEGRQRATQHILYATGGGLGGRGT